MRIAFLGAGSFVFTRKLVIDLFSFPDMPPVELALMDIDPERLQTVHSLVHKVIGQERRPVAAGMVAGTPGLLTHPRAGHAG